MLTRDQIEMYVSFAYLSYYFNVSRRMSQLLNYHLRNSSAYILLFSVNPTWKSRRHPHFIIKGGFLL